MTHGRVADLIIAIPYLISSDLIPPAQVLNEVLRTGTLDAGMSGAVDWEPFTLSTEDHAALVRELESRVINNERQLRYEPPPEWVTTRSEWSIWVANRLHGIPSDENRRLERQMEEISKLMQAAADSKDEEARFRLACQLNEVAMEWSEFVNSHRTQNHHKLLANRTNWQTGHQ